MGFLPQFLTVSGVFEPEGAGAPSGCGVVLSVENFFRAESVEGERA